MKVLNEFIAAVLMERRSEASDPQYLVRALKNAIMRQIEFKKDSMLVDFSRSMGNSPNEDDVETAELFDEIVDLALERAFKISELNANVSLRLGKNKIGRLNLDDIVEDVDIDRISSNHGYFVLQHKPGAWLMQPLLTHRIEEVDWPETLYHVTPIWGARRIMKKGIIPGSGRRVGTHARRNIPNRVYLSISRDASDDMADAFAMTGDGDFDEKYVTFLVDPGGLSKGTKLYSDPESPTSVWTFSTIPASALTLDPDDEELLQNIEKKEER